MIQYTAQIAGESYPMKNGRQNERIVKLMGRLFIRSTLLFLALFSFFLQSGAKSLDISNRYSPLNQKRPLRPETRFIILHTTEGGETGSLRKVRRYGEAHYFVTKSGKVYRIIDRRRIATHTGRSMWQGKTNLDNSSIGIEVVGTYNRDITTAQYEALKELLRQLQSVYKIAGRNVLTHSQVAYGRPNRFHRSNHRGRKRCGTIFANPNVRQRLGLTDQPTGDPDVLAGRLKVADPELQRMLYAAAPAAAAAKPALDIGDDDAEPGNGDPTLIGKGNNAWNIARERYNHPETVYIFPKGDRLRGDQIRNWDKIPPGTRVLFSDEEPEQGFEGFLEIGKDGSSFSELAGDDYDASTTIYFFPNGLIRTGEELTDQASLRKYLDNPPGGTRVLVGYVYGGYVMPRRSAYYIARKKWNYPSTFYRLPNGRILSGDEVEENMIPSRTLIFFQN